MQKYARYYLLCALFLRHMKQMYNQVYNACGSMVYLTRINFIIVTHLLKLNFNTFLS